MNSLPDNKLEETLDQLLASSVSAGSEPEGLHIGSMPSRPQFQWMYLVYAAGVFSLSGFFFVQWLLGLHLEGISIHLFSLEEVVALLSRVSSGTLVTLVGIFTVAAFILPEKLKILYRISCF